MMQEKLRALLERHCETLRANAEEIRQCLTLRAGGEGGVTAAPTDLERAVDLAHQIKGSSGSIGFHEVSEVGSELEDRLKACGQGDGSALLAAMTALEKLQYMVGSLTPEQSTLFNANLDRLHVKKTKAG